MSYFRLIPELEYQSFLPGTSSSKNYITVKNLFKVARLRDDLQNVFTIFNKYEIKEGSRPDLIAEEFYGSAEYDWVVLVCAGITNYRDQWPLSDNDFYKYCLKIYKNEQNLYSPHHYETIEIRDSEDRLILPKGKIVDKEFTLSYKDGDRIYSNDPEVTGPNVYPIGKSIVIEISNYDYEIRKNDDKRTIYLLKPEYLIEVLNDIEDIMTYDESSEFVNDRIIKTENTKVVLK